jgi:type II secretory pathway pseudopilin PulG
LAGSAGFSLVEAMVALTITAVAGSALLLGVDTSLKTTNEAMEQTIATGMAEQLMDEVLGARYTADMAGDALPHYDPDPYDPDSARFSITRDREFFEDIDDYNEYTNQPPQDRFGVDLGSDDGEGDERHPSFKASAGMFSRWRRQIQVYYVSPTDLKTPLAAGQTSDYRAVEVRVLLDDPQRGWRELARLQQVVAYVPPIQ